MICPFMSYAANMVPCQKEECAVWDKREDACGILGGPRRMEDAFRDLNMTLNEIKVKF